MFANLTPGDTDFVIKVAQNVIASGMGGNNGVAGGTNADDVNGITANSGEQTLALWQALGNQGASPALGAPIQALLVSQGVLTPDNMSYLLNNPVGVFDAPGAPVATVMPVTAPPVDAYVTYQPDTPTAAPPPPQVVVIKRPPRFTAPRPLPPRFTAPRPLPVQRPVRTAARPAASTGGKIAILPTLTAQDVALATNWVQALMGGPGDKSLPYALAAKVTAHNGNSRENGVVFGMWQNFMAIDRNHPGTINAHRDGFNALNKAVTTLGFIGLDGRVDSAFASNPIGSFKLDQATARTFFPGVRSGQFAGETDPQVLVESADTHFKAKAAALANGLLAGNPTATAWLQQVRKGGATGNWADKQILGYLRAALDAAGAPVSLIASATMHGEDAIRSAVESHHTNANRGDQNSMAVLDGVRESAMRGNPIAILAHRHHAALLAGDFGAAIKRTHVALRRTVATPSIQAATPAATTAKAKQHHRKNPWSGQTAGGSDGGGGGSSSGGSGGNNGGSDDDGGDEDPRDADVGADGRPRRIPIDRLVQAAGAGNASAKTELGNISAAAAAGDTRAVSLMAAIRARTVNTPRGKMARAAGLSQGLPLTRVRVASLAGDFGAEYGPEGEAAFRAGLESPSSPIPSTTPEDIATCISTGQVVTMARNLQAARVPGANLSGFDEGVGDEMGDMPLEDCMPRMPHDDVSIDPSYAQGFNAVYSGGADPEYQS